MVLDAFSNQRMNINLIREVVAVSNKKSLPENMNISINSKLYRNPRGKREVHLITDYSKMNIHLRSIRF